MTANTLTKLALSICLLALAAAGCKKAPGEGGPTPTPSPSAVPSPTPNPRADLSPSCKRIPEGIGSNGANCKPTQIRFEAQVLAAMAQVPGSMVKGDGTVRNVKAYTDFIVDYFDRTWNVCAYWDGERLFVRDAQNNNEYYRLFQANGVRDSLFTTNCSPAERYPDFQAGVDPYHTDPGCGLPRGNLNDTVECDNVQTPGNPNSRYKQDMYNVLTDIVAEEKTNPTFMDASDWTDESCCYKIQPGKESIFLERVRSKLRTRGYCTDRDFDGVHLKKGTNEYSEFWDLIHRNPRGTFMSRVHFANCNPTEF